MGGKTFLSMPVRSDGEVIAALNLILKTEVLESSTLSFASPSPAIVAQVKTPFCTNGSKEELAERERMQTRTLELESPWRWRSSIRNSLQTCPTSLRRPQRHPFHLRALEVKGQKQAGGTHLAGRRSRNFRVHPAKYLPLAQSHHQSFRRDQARPWVLPAGFWPV